MFIFSTKVTKRKLISLALICSCLALIILLSLPPSNTTVDNVNQVVAKTNEERVGYLTDFGWAVSTEPIEVVDVVIPTSFDEVYESYNMLQKLQGFDLANYKGKKATRYTYEVTNYPTPQDSPIHANMLLVDNKLIGGDITSVSMGGFMHGFEMPNDVVDGDSSDDIFNEEVVGPSVDEIMSEVLDDTGK
ncbi:MAG: hypothetical protein K0S55_21 [Clostridia bacterium]|nr:hypothetical protein [Clostridia bacterium]